MKRTIVMIVLVAVVGGTAFFVGTRLHSTSTSPQPTVSSGSSPTVAPGKSSKNPFGVFFNPRAFDLDQRVRMAQELGAKYFRSLPALVPTWTGRCDECMAVHRANLHFVLTIRNSSDITQPASPATDLGAFKRTVADMLRQYRPAVVVVENEEDSPTYWAGTPQQYVDELRAVCEVSHGMKIPCANGGLLSLGVTWLVYQHYLDTGQKDKADSFAQRGLQDFQRKHLDSPDYVRQIADHEMSFVKAYRAAGIDYLNIHWYVDDDQALQETVDYMKTLTGLPVISNEMGQRSTDPNTVVGLMDKALALKMRFVVWFSSDGRLSKALVDPDGSIRPNGEAFRSVIQKAFG